MRFKFPRELRWINPTHGVSATHTGLFSRRTFLCRLVSTVERTPCMYAGCPGPIPAELGMLSALEQLLLHMNKLTGELLYSLFS